MVLFSKSRWHGIIFNDFSIRTPPAGPLHRDPSRRFQNQSQMVLSHSLEKLRGQGSSDIYLDLRDHYHQHVYGHHHLIILIAIINIIITITIITII